MCTALPYVQAAARLEEQAGNMSKARATLEQGRHRNRGNEELWLTSVRTEQRAGLPKAADSLMAKALQVGCAPDPSCCSCTWCPCRCAHVHMLKTDEKQALMCSCSACAGVPHIRHPACGGHQHGAAATASCQVGGRLEALQRRSPHHCCRRAAVLARPQGQHTLLPAPSLVREYLCRHLHAL